jgi:hypothetical protein
MTGCPDRSDREATEGIHAVGLAADLKCDRPIPQ